MRRLIRPSEDDRGAVAALLAVILGGGVLLGMAAVVVDVGRLYAEREQLQTGADAAAFAVAETCVRLPESCADQGAEAERYAAAVAADGAAGIAEICGRGPGLADCSAPATNRTACLGTAPETGSYAEVRTRTLGRDGSTLLPRTFARALAGDDMGTSVGACARVAWGPPLRAAGTAVTFSTCEWEALTDGGLTLWPPPSDGTPPASAERVVRLKGSPSATTCPAGPSGWDRPGGFGWLDDTERNCTTTVETDGSFGGDTGSSVSSACRTALAALRDERRLMLIPIYDGVTGTGSSTTYHLAGFASFVLTGYYQSGFTAPSRLTGLHHCEGSERCLYGYFTRALVPTTGVTIGGPDLGVSVVNSIG
ncbi:pilus assembly protein TadG-related protein [Actinoplanes sp. NPDC049599]|uniref:pilus assembly protein TadG-related protein n=1 Tax=Actinoplanes sp. NPDC049599 TaxID=3363903 RepID=UPI0037A6C1B0